MIGTTDIYRLKEIRSSVVKKYEYEVSKKKEPRKWALILECIELIISFVISNGLKIKWYNPMIIFKALALIKKIIDLVIVYLKKNKN